MDMVEFIEEIKKLAALNRDQYLREIEKDKKTLKIEGFDSIDPVINMYATRDAMIALAQDKKLDALSVQSFNSICASLGCMVEYSCAMVEDAGIPVACESDIHGAISAVLLKAASMGEEKIIFADLTVRHPEDDNAILIWHCGFPESLRDKKKQGSIGTHWILPGIPPGSCHWELKEGPLTAFRFDGDRGKYYAISGEGHSVPGPKTLNTYVWMKVNDWPAWERAFIYGPYIHHVVCCYGNYSKVLAEASRYIPGLHYEQLP